MVGLVWGTPCAGWIDLGDARCWLDSTLLVGMGWGTSLAGWIGSVAPLAGWARFASHCLLVGLIQGLAAGWIGLGDTRCWLDCFGGTPCRLHGLK